MATQQTARARDAKAPRTTKPTSGSETARARDEYETRSRVHDALTGAALYWARRPFGYNGAELDRGQVLGLVGAVNDEKLIRLGYVLSVLPEDRPHRCRQCPAQFVDLETLNAHGAKRHSGREHEVTLPSERVVGNRASGLTVDENAAEVQALEREQALMEQLAPLNLDKTKASREARA